MEISPWPRLQNISWFIMLPCRVYFVVFDIFLFKSWNTQHSYRRALAKGTLYFLLFNNHFWRLGHIVLISQHFILTKKITYVCNANLNLILRYIGHTFTLILYRTKKIMLQFITLLFLVANGIIVVIFLYGLKNYSIVTFYIIFFLMNSICFHFIWNIFKGNLNRIKSKPRDETVFYTPIFLRQ